ncbi:MAG TPA: ABC transporter permease [Terriglobia bacterium]|nr:ABC transporter permease [Terriglobia bacterium]
MGTLLQDLKYGLRMLKKSPGFTAVAIVALALGIGANTSMYSSINAMLLHPFAFQDLDRAVTVWETVPKQNRDHMSVAAANFRDWHEQAKGFEVLAALRGWNVNLTGEDLAERLEGFQVSADFFPLLGIPAQLGRTVAADNFGTGRSNVVVLSHGFWQRHLGGDPSMVGKNVLLSGQKYTVIGIMPSDFDFPVGADAWAPLDFTVKEASDRANHTLEVFGRLKPGVSKAKAQDDLESIAARLGHEYPETNAGHSARVVGLVDDLTYGSKQFVGVLMGAAGFVLLLACANVANLLLARVTGRQKEIAVRLALGASRWRVTRQLMVESTLVSLLGGVGGLLLADWYVGLSQSSIPPFIVQHVPGLKHLQPDWHVLVFTIAVALLAGILAGVVPAVHVSRPNLNDVLKEGTRGGTASPGRRRLRSLLVVTEIALALVLLVSAGLMVTGFRNVAKEEMGFDRSHVLTFRISLAESKYSNPDRVRGFYEQLIPRLESLPGVESAGAVTAVPGGWWGWDSTPYSAEGEPPAAPGEIRSTGEQSVTPGFFRVLRVSLIKGRFLSPQDGPDAPLVVDISEGLARQIWPHEEAMGKRLRFGRPENNGPWRTVVGVVGSVRPSPWDKRTDLTAYFPLAQAPQASTGVVVRTPGDPLALVAATRSQVLSLDSEQPPYDPRSLEQLISDDVSGVEYSARTMTLFGVLALVLAAAGIFAVMAYSVLQRTHEIGVRMALGARRADVLKLVIGYAAKLSAIGLGIGVVGALAMTRLLTTVLLGVVRMDLPAFAGITALLAVVAALAAYVPARWAAKVDPMVALRYE